MIKFILLSLCITTALFSQSLEHKISQMLMVGFPGNELTDSTIINDIQLRKIGGVILMGYNITSPSQVQQLTNSLQSNSQTPLFISVDQEGGRVARLKETNGFAATKTAFEIGTLINNEDSTRVWASLMAGWLQQSGFNVNLAPVADVNVNPNSPAIGLLDRSFSEIPEQVFQHNSWFINEFHDKNIFTTLKHFPGHGSANTDSHFGFTDITNTWSDSELIPFHKLIQQGYDDFVMSGHLFNANLDSIHPASLSQKVMTNLLRDTLGFNGLVITDGMFMGAITNNYTFDKAVELAINAGNDILLYTSNKIEGRSLVDSIVGIVLNKISVGLITEARIDESYQRIMIKKQNLTNIYLSDDAIIPSGFGLTNYPNPFNATTKIVVIIPVSGNMNLKVYNIIGEEIAEIVNEYFNSGTHRFFFDAKELTSGVYLLVLNAGEKYFSHKIVLIK
ncbi:MAG: glycoside hydrolase family 3 N-terminal domain-containing protein [Ignavibacteriaceae bacterium]